MGRLLHMKCDECMHDAPYSYCCKCECGQHEFCSGCIADSKGSTCLNEEYLSDC